MTELDNISKEEQQRVNSRVKKFADIFDRQGEGKIRDKIQEAETEQLVKDDFISDLKQLTNDSKTISYINSLQEQLEEALGIKHKSGEFDLDKYKDLNKTRLAQEMAQYANNQLKIKPVDMDRRQDNTALFQYDRETGLWRYFSQNKIGRLCSTLAQKEYSSHLEREFTKNLVNSSDYKHHDEMGLPPNEILLDNKKVLMLDTRPAPYDTRTVEASDDALYRMDVEYDPNAECPQFKEFVDKLLDGKENQIKTLQEFMGWLLKFPDNSYKKALIILGVSNSGKSQLADLLYHMFNNKATQSLSLAQLGMERRFHVHRLKEAIVNIDRDMTSQNIESTDTLKQVISQEPIAVEPKGEDTRVIEPESKMMVMSNVAPEPSNQEDSAFYGRFLTLKAPNSVDPENRVPNFGEKLYDEEASGILNWMLEGLERLEQNKGFTLDPEPVDTKMMWNEYGDSAQRFLWECGEKVSPEEFVTVDEAYEEYEIWLEDKMMHKKTIHNFKNKLAAQTWIEQDRVYHEGRKQQAFRGLNLDTDSGNLNT